MNEIKRQCEILLSYPIGKLFTEDNPTTKRKKEEARCTKLVDQYWSIEAPVHNRIRELLRDIESTPLLGCNECMVVPLLEASGALEAQYEAHRKTITKNVKSEPALKEYYSVLWNKMELFGTMLCKLFDVSEAASFTLDTSMCKMVYYNSYKAEKVLIKGRGGNV